MPSLSIPADISESLSESELEQAKILLERNLLPCLLGNRAPEQTNINASRIGGPVFLPADLEVPCDRNGKAMIFVAQFNFADLQCHHEIGVPKTGLFMLFWNAARDSSNPKDRNAFRCVWIPDPNFSTMISTADSTTCITSSGITFRPAWSVPQNQKLWNLDVDEKQEQLPTITKVLEKSQQAELQLFGHAGANFDILQETAAFAGNGVSWSSARRTDSCFSHLVETAKDWRLFAKISSLPECGLNLGDSSLYILIRHEDFETQNFSKAWLLRSA